MSRSGEATSVRRGLASGGPASQHIRLALVLAVLVACGSSQPPPTPMQADLVVTHADCTKPPARMISHRDAAADLDVVERVLRRGYAGFEPLARRGVDWTAAFAKLRDDLAALPEPIDVEQLRDWLATELAFTNDNHLGVYTVASDGSHASRSAGSHLDAFAAPSIAVERVDGAWHAAANLPQLGGEPVTHCEPEVEMRPVVNGGRRIWVPIALAHHQPDAIRCELASGTMSSLALPITGSYRNGPAFERREAGAPILRLRSFDPTKRTELDAFVATAVELRNAKAIVLDVRGNQGGSDDFVRAWFRDLTSDTLHGPTIDMLISDVNAQGTSNLATCHGGISQLRPSDYRVWKTFALDDKGRAPAPYRGTIVVVTDRDCASSCESLVHYARQLPNTIVVGENTAGTGVFGEVVPYRLPRSGIWLQAGTKWFHDRVRNQTAIEGTGYLPDLWLDKPDDTTVDNLARCVADPACAAEIASWTHAPT